MRRVVRRRWSIRAWQLGLLLLLAVVSCWKVEADLVVSTTELNFGSGIDSLDVAVRNDSEDNALTTGVTALNTHSSTTNPG
jgi:hypothetical protein